MNVTCPTQQKERDTPVRNGITVVIFSTLFNPYKCYKNIDILAAICLIVFH